MLREVVKTDCARAQRRWEGVSLKFTMIHFVVYKIEISPFDDITTPGELLGKLHTFFPK